MSRTPLVGGLLLGMLFSCGDVGAGVTATTAQNSKVAADTRSPAVFAAPLVAGSNGLMSDGASPAPWDGTAPDMLGQPHDAGDASNRSGLDFSGPTGLGAPSADALPLSQFAAGKGASAHAHAGVWDFLDRVRYGRLPEPASWALILIGFGMIGGAVRGFVVANRRLARLQPEDSE